MRFGFIYRLLAPSREKPATDSVRSKQIGQRGESIVASYLASLSDEYTTFNNVVLSHDNTTTQIDHLVVSKYGVFAIETKNYRGILYGTDKRQNWTQIIKTDVVYPRKPWKTYTHITKSTFYNPVKQAWGHCFVLKQLLKEFPHLPIVPIIVFAGYGDLSNIQTANYIVHDVHVLSVISKYKSVFLSEQGLQRVKEIIQSNNVRYQVDDWTHINNIRQKKKEADNLAESGICPRCKGQLVRRKGPSGMFWGCSNYPKCKFTTLYVL